MFKEIGPVTHSRVRDHLSLALESRTGKGESNNDGVAVVSRHTSGGPCEL